MKSFRQHITKHLIGDCLTEEQLLFEKKDHIIKKIPSLTNNQKKEVIDFFRTKPNLENKIDWNRWKRLTYDDFRKVMDAESPSQKKRRRQKERRLGLKGLQRGKDYIEIKTKNKDYDVYVPLNPKAARVIASTHFGNCHGKWCLANTQANRYYKSEAKKRGLVPVMVVGDGAKWTVMMNRFGTPSSIWDQDNEGALHGEVIPGFSIKKELGNKKMADLYEEIIDNIWPKQIKVPKGFDRREFTDAVDAYDELVDDTIDMVESAIADYEQYLNTMKEQLDDSIEYYEDELDTYKNHELPNAKTEEERKEIEDIIRDYEEKLDRLKEYKDNDDLYELLDDYLNTSELDDIEIDLYEYERDYRYNQTPDVNDYKYEDYFDFVEKYYPEDSQVYKDDLQDTIYEIENDFFYGGGGQITEEEVIDAFEFSGAYSPEKMKDELEKIYN
jgi:hypothetical protein